MTGDDDIRNRLLEAALAHVPFDGWSEASFRAAARDAGVEWALARAVAPRGAVDLALAYHARGDAEMLRRLAAVDLAGMRIRDRITLALRTRMEVIEDRELVRRASTLFALPHHAADGARCVWASCDAIWTAIGDRSEDVNWYTKRATLAAVYSALLLYWLGDDSPGHRASWEFLDRRIDDVMKFEGAKARMRGNPLLKPLIAGLGRLTANVRPPQRRDDLPGRLGPRT